MRRELSVLLRKLKFDVEVFRHGHVVNWAFRSRESRFVRFGVSKYFDVTPTRFAELPELLGLTFCAMDFVRVRGGALVEFKFDVTDLLRGNAIGKRSVREKWGLDCVKCNICVT
jgi:hypothetical protein